MTAQKKLGIIQSRGLGDIVIALPIADYWRQEGYDIYWPICHEFISHFDQVVPWVRWLPVNTDNGSFFYDQPRLKLVEEGVEEFLCLYQALTGHPELTARPEFQITKFDQLKYHAAGVPFLRKWQLSKCIQRQPDREQALIKQLKIKSQEPYVIIHDQGSDARAQWDPNWIPSGRRVIRIEPLTDCVFDWLAVLEGADAIITIDSVFSNIIDQLAINTQVDCYFIPRSHIHLTPVLGGAWTVLDPGREVAARISIFKPG